MINNKREATPLFYVRILRYFLSLKATFGGTLRIALLLKKLKVKFTNETSAQK